MPHYNVIIIGGGTAGMSVVHELHAAQCPLTVALIKDEETNVNRGALPYGLDPQKPVGKFLISNKLVTLFGADLIVDSVQQIMPEHNQLTTATDKIYTYDHLVLATGAHPLFPPIPGLDAAEVYSVRWKYELFALRDAIQRQPKVVVLSSDPVGVEVAAILHGLGAHVTLLDFLPHLLAGTLPEDYAPDVEQYLTSQRLTVKTNARVAEVLCPQGHVSGVHLDDGTLLDADFVVLSLGNEAETDLARRSGLMVSPFGIMTDEYLRTNVANIYATGDCAEKKSWITKQPVHGDSDANAILMSKVVAANIAGRQKAFPGVLNAYVMKAFDLLYGVVGVREITAKTDLDVVIGSSESLSKYPMLDGAKPVKTRLMFDRNIEKIVGGSILRYDGNVAADVEILSLAIQMGMTCEQFLDFQYPTHPELTAKPTENRFILAAQEALKKLC